MGMLDCDWDSLYVEAARYLKNYDEDIRIDTTTARYDRGPQVDAILPLKGKKEVNETSRPCGDGWFSDPPGDHCSACVPSLRGRMNSIFLLR